MVPATNRQDSQSGFRGPCIFFVFQRAEAIFKESHPPVKVCGTRFAHLVVRTSEFLLDISQLKQPRAAQDGNTYRAYCELKTTARASLSILLWAR
jgi:hypothetical protein